jgi:hypothetical protein
MNASRSRNHTFSCVLFLFLTIPAGAALLGPSPYLSRTNSPFFQGILEGTTFLETFEDGLLNTPGVSVSSGTVNGPGGNVDSVDADDGLIDGSGTGGRSFFEQAITGIRFTFNTNVLGSYPTHAGLVWTDGINQFRFEAWDAQGASLGFIATNLGDMTFAGTTAEDRFFGVTNDTGISAIRISGGPGTGLEMDHLQYGVPRSPTTVTIYPAAEICWYAITNVRYQPQWTFLLNTNWFDLGPPVNGNGATNCLLDTTRDYEKKFYRVITLP